MVGSGNPPGGYCQEASSEPSADTPNTEAIDGKHEGMMLQRAELKKPKARTCKVCRGKFIPVRSIQPTCDSFDCKVTYAERVAEKAAAKRVTEDRKKTREQKMAAKKPQYWRKRAENAVNAFVRERDAEQPCISCGTHDAAAWHAGHFIPVGRSSFLRYDPVNIHKQCDHCNVFKGGNATEYEKRLIGRIGLAEVERLKCAPRLRDWTREECQAIEAEFKSKLADLKAQGVRA